MKSFHTWFFGLTVVALLNLAGATPRANATVTSFQEGVAPTGAYTHDAVYIRESEADTNQNGDPDQEVIVGFTNDDNELRGLFEFDISDIPASDQIDAASLVLHTGGGLSSSITINAYAYALDFDETTATWNDPDVGATDVAGGTLGTLLSSATFDPTVTADISFADSAAFQSAVSSALAGDGFLRLILARSDASRPGTQRFARFDDETVSPSDNRPELIITHSEVVGAITPEPSTAMLAMFAMLGLAAGRRRHDRR